MPRQASLVYTLPDGREEEQPLTPGREASIGRHPHCTVTVSQPSVSRKHAKLEFDGQSCMVEDLGSSNGTYVNNQRITRSALRDGDELRCGDFRLRYVEKEASAAPSPRIMESRPDAPKLKFAGRLSTGRPTMQPQGGVRPTMEPRQVNQSAGGSDLNRAEPARVGPPPGRRPDPRPDPLPEAPDDSFIDDPQKAIARLREEAAEWRGLYERLKATGGGGGESEADREEKARLQGRIDELRTDVEQRERRIAELEAARARAQEQAETQAERAVQLRGQVDAERNQAEEYRREMAELRASLGETQQRLEQLRANQEIGGQRESDLADEVNNLKREVRQREKTIRDVQQQLEVIEYDLQSARKQNEELKFVSEDDRAKIRTLNEQLDHLRQVDADKQEMLEGAQGELARWRQRAEHAEERAREAGGAHATQLSEALDAERQARNDAERRAEQLARSVADLERKVAEAGQASASTRRLMDQINELKRENRDLRHLADGAGQGDPAKLAELEQRLDVAERERHDAESARVRAEGEVRQLQSLVDRLQSGAGGGGALLEQAVEVYEGLNDLAADLRTNVDLSGGMIRDLRPIVEAAESLRAGESGAAVAAIRRTAEEIDAALTMESAEEAIGRAEESAQRFRRQMRRFRELLQSNGYGS